ncbi:hypothetical protein HN51_024831 [Arachis hypogaea]|uniref:Protein CHUP1, chloroplastic n=1 Tax=Arachis hypogaea TaxID=3818 RepID=A0A445C6V3_ARAHY|nr:protein CHUP1, chloroplastic [Arachis hypogaea]QHO27907.1 Protein CHUP1 [Arachis hypogaea]RYR46662.1 hypothetical protein Ahy_A07g032431 [Arachis hypogaea]
MAMFLMRKGEKMLKEESESEIFSPKKIITQVQMSKNELLEKENLELKQEVARLKSLIVSLKAHNVERKSMLWKKIHKSIDDSNSDSQLHKAAVMAEKCPENQNVLTNQEFKDSIKEGSVTKVPNPPPSPPSFLLPSHNKLQLGAPPPPPPALLKSSIGLKAVRRVPEVIELYRSLTRKEANTENRINLNGGIPALAFTRNMIEEIENRSSYLSAIKCEVQRQGDFVNLLIKEVESTSFSDISEVETFIRWLDGELSSLVDERSVLKHFPQWPEQKVDALREAACNYRDLKSLELEVSCYEENPKEALPQALKRIHALQDRLETSVSAKERTREITTNKYRNFHIPWDWMMDTGLVGQMKLSSLRLAKEFMKRVTKELESREALQEDNLLLQGVKFAFRVHQFAGGFDPETTQAFQELKRVGGVQRRYSNMIKCTKFDKSCQKLM